jgi:hypothetical protein
MPSAPSQLHRQVGQIDGAFAHFEAAVLHATRVAARHGGKLGAEQEIRAMNGVLRDIHAKFGDEAGTITVEKVDERPEADLLGPALNANLSAALEAARAVRMSVKSNNDLVVQGDLKKVTRHTGEVARLLEQLPNAKALKEYQDRGHKLLDELRAVERDVAGKRSLVEILSSDFHLSVQTIQTKLAHRR